MISVAAQAGDANATAAIAAASTPFTPAAIDFTAEPFCSLRRKRMNRQVPSLGPRGRGCNRRIRLCRLIDESVGIAIFPASGKKPLNLFVPPQTLSQGDLSP